MQSGGYSRGKWWPGQDREVSRNVIEPYNAANVIKRAIRKRIAQRNYGPMPGEPARQTKIQKLRLAKWNYMRRDQPTWFGKGIGTVSSRLANILPRMFARQNEAKRVREGSRIAGYWKRRKL